MPSPNAYIAEAELYAYVQGMIDQTHASLPSQAVGVRRTTLRGSGTPRVMADRRAAADRRKTYPHFRAQRHD
jgi:hypothetical protein